MATTYTTLLGLAKPTQGELTGTWGTVVNDYITTYLDSAIAGTQTISGTQTAVTLSVANGATLSQAGAGATGSSQYMVINCTGTPASLLTITVPNASKTYVVINATAQSVKLVGTGPTSGVTLVASEKAVCSWNGTDFVKVASSAISNLTGTLPVANGGTGLTAGTSGGVLAYTATGTLASSAALTQYGVVYGGGAGVVPAATANGTTGQVLTALTGGAPGWAAAAGGGSAATPTVLGTVYAKQTTSGGTPYLTAFGYNAGVVNTGVSNVAVGVDALKANTSGTGNTAIGHSALVTNITGVSNTAVGRQTLESNTNSYNVAVGTYALQANTSGDSNTGMGYAALLASTTGANNVGIGRSALGQNTTGSNNTAVGYQALYSVNNAAAVNNTAIGKFAGGSGAGGANMYGNTLIGMYAGYVTTGNYNACLGYYTGANISSGSYNDCIGAEAGTEAGVVNITTQNNYIAMGSASKTNAYIRIAWTVTSDARDKTEIKPVPHGLSFVNQLNPVSFKLTKSREDNTPTGDVRYGFLAQDILALEGADSVVIDAKDAENLKYTDQNMTAILVKAIQELKAEFDAYKATHP
jgi:hypothetical protein